MKKKNKKFSKTEKNQNSPWTYAIQNFFWNKPITIKKYAPLFISKFKLINSWDFCQKLNKKTKLTLKVTVYLAPNKNSLQIFKTAIQK